MLCDLQPYPAYKDSGVPWLGELPEAWQVLPNRALFAEVKERNHPDEELLSVTITQGVIRQRALLADSSKRDSSNQDKTAYKLVRPGDIAYNKMRAWQGAVGVSEYRGIVSPAYVIVRPRAGQNPHYFHYLLRTPAFATEAERWSYGITSDQWSLRPEHFKMIYCALPSPREQSAIVRFLDYIDRRIRRYILARKKLIALLSEQKQAITHRAVTRGLDPNVRLKPSGVEWLGHVPGHWEVVFLRHVTRSRCDGPFGSGLKSSHYVDSGVRVVRLQNIGYAEFKGRDTAYISPEHYATLGDHSVVAGDLLIAGLGDEKIPPGRACVAPGGIEPAMVKADCFRFRTDPARVDASFAALQLSATALSSSSVMSNGATRQRVNLRSTSARPILLPPMTEQLCIVCRLRELAASRDRALATVQREVDLLREYRTRLFADVVTGKLDVREAAARLPEEPMEIESIDDADALAEDAEEGDAEVATEEAEA